MSFGVTRIDPKRLNWEQVVSGELLDELFLCVLPDDALAPDHPRGTDYVWSTVKKPGTGSIVMVRDRHGQLHARVRSQGNGPDHWIAAATGLGYRNLDSDADGLQLVAVAAYKALP